MFQAPCGNIGKLRQRRSFLLASLFPPLATELDGFDILLTFFHERWRIRDAFPLPINPAFIHRYDFPQTLFTPNYFTILHIFQYKVDFLLVWVVDDFKQ